MMVARFDTSGVWRRAAIGKLVVYSGDNEQNNKDWLSQIGWRRKIPKLKYSNYYVQEIDG